FSGRTRTLAGGLRQSWGVLGTLVAAAGAIVLRDANGIGSHGSALSYYPPLAQLLPNLETQALALLYAGGWVIVPGAILAFVLMIGRPETRAELAFASFAAALTAGLLVQASVWGEPTVMQERYTFYAVPMLAIAFARLVMRGWPWPRLYALGCLALVVVAATIPLSTYVTHLGNR